MNTAEKPSFVWQVDVPLLTNRLVMKQLTLVLGSACVFVFLLIALIQLIDGETGSIPAFALIFSKIFVFLFALCLLAIIVFLGNRMPTLYEMDNHGIRQSTLSRRARAATRSAAVGGLLLGPRGWTLAGAGGIALSREAETLRWNEVSSVRYRASACEIRLGNKWRTLMQVICTQDNYAAVAEFVRMQTANRTNQRPPKWSRRAPGRTSPAKSRNLTQERGGPCSTPNNLQPSQADVTAPPSQCWLQQS